MESLYVIVLYATDEYAHCVTRGVFTTKDEAHEAVRQIFHDKKVSWKQDAFSIGEGESMTSGEIFLCVSTSSTPAFLSRVKSASNHI